MTSSASQHRFYRKANLTLLGVGLMLAVLTTSLQAWFYQENIHREQISQLQKSIQPHLQSLTNALWDIDSAQIRQEIDFLVNLPDVVRVELNTPLGQSYVQGRINGAQTNHTILHFEIHHPQSAAPLGSATFQIQNKSLWPLLKKSSMLSFGVQLVQLATILILLNFFLHRRLFQRLKTLTRHLQQIHHDTLHLPPPDTGAKNPDELDELTAALSQMQLHLIQDQQSARQTESTLRNTLEHAENELARRTGEAVYISGFLCQLLRLSTDFLRIPPAKTESALREALQEISVLLGLDTCFVIAIREDNQAIITGFWRKETLPVAPLEVYYTRSRADYACSLGLLANDTLVQIDTATLDSDSQEARLAQLLKLEKLVLVKLESSGQAIGLLCGGASESHRTLNELETRLLNMTGNILASLLVNQQAQAKLQTISTELAHAHTEINALASQDPLTGLSNERSFREAVSRELRRAQRIDSPLALVVLEMSHYEEYVDLHGRQASDTILRRMAAEIIRNASRTGDLITRIAPARFALLLPDTSAEGALALAQQLHAALSALTPANAEDASSRPPSINAALVRCTKCQHAELETLLELSAQALSQATLNGGSRIEIIDAQ